MKTTIRKITKRCNGNSLLTIIRQLNQVLRGWFEYYQHACKYVFSGLDGWIRRRLRRILRKRNKKNKGTGGNITDHIKWPNQFFFDKGLFSLEKTHKEKIQSLRRTH